MKTILILIKNKLFSVLFYPKFILKRVLFNMMKSLTHPKIC